LLSGFLQQQHNWIGSGVSNQTPHPIGPDFNAGAIGFGKDRIADRRACQANPRMSCDHQDPGFPIGIERPNRIRREIDPLKHKMRACNEDRSSGGEMSWGGLSLNWPDMGSGDGAFLRAAGAAGHSRTAERNVATLLNLGKHDAGAYGVDRAGGDEDDFRLLRQDAIASGWQSSRP